MGSYERALSKSDMSWFNFLKDQLWPLGGEWTGERQKWQQGAQLGGWLQESEWEDGGLR